MEYVNNIIIYGGGLLIVVGIFLIPLIRCVESVIVYIRAGAKVKEAKTLYNSNRETFIAKKIQLDERQELIEKSREQSSAILCENLRDRIDLLVAENDELLDEQADLKKALES